MRLDSLAGGQKTGNFIVKNCKTKIVENDNLNLHEETFKVDRLPGVPKNFMKFLLRYDLLTFALIFGGGIVTVVVKNISADERWMMFSLLYWCKTFYQVFSIPFLVLKIPGLKTFLTHAKKTGYKPNGTLVLHKKRQKVKTT